MHASVQTVVKCIVYVICYYAHAVRTTFWEHAQLVHKMGKPIADTITYLEADQPRLGELAGCWDRLMAGVTAWKSTAPTALAAGVVEIFNRRQQLHLPDAALAARALDPIFAKPPPTANGPWKMGMSYLPADQQIKAVQVLKRIAGEQQQQVLGTELAKLSLEAVPSSMAVNLPYLTGTQQKLEQLQREQAASVDGEWAEAARKEYSKLNAQQPKPAARRGFWSLPGATAEFPILSKLAGTCCLLM